MSRFSASVRQELPEFRWTWAAEPNPGKTGVHVHGYAHTGASGRVLCHVPVVRAAKSAGLGRQLELKQIEPGSDAAYFQYPMKSLADPELEDEYLALNGSSKRICLIRSSKSGFWRLGANGPTVRRAEAEVEAYARSRAPHNGRSVVSPPPSNQGEL